MGGVDGLVCLRAPGQASRAPGGYNRRNQPSPRSATMARRSLTAFSASLLLLGLAVPVRTDEVKGVHAGVALPGEVDYTARRLEAADKLAAAKRWAEAVE